MGLTRFSSRKLAAGRRATAYRDALGTAMNLEVASIAEAPLEVDATFLTLPGIVLAVSHLSPLAMVRSAALAADGNDDVVVSLPLVGSALYRQGPGGEVICAPGEGYLLHNDEKSEIRNGSMSRVSLAISRSVFRPNISALDAVPRGPISASPALALLASYAQLLTAGGALDPDLERPVADHLCDLLAVALGEGAPPAGAGAGRGVRAARLAAIKADIVRNVGRSEITLSSVARRHGISPQYVRSLFAGDRTTFSDFVRNERLGRVLRAITDPKLAHVPISGIVYEVGFGDLSYFNRLFRRVYGMTPSDARVAALGPDAGRRR